MITDIEHIGVEALTIVLSCVLSAAIGFERQRKRKSAGVRTHTLVGVGATVFTLVSAYGFRDVLTAGSEALDPSRITAQIVSGVGFLGAGLIFVRRGREVSGLTTAASVWVTAAIGTACGAGMPVLAILATVTQIAAVTGIGYVNSRRNAASRSRIVGALYARGNRTLRTILSMASSLEVQTRLLRHTNTADDRRGKDRESVFVFTGSAASLDELQRRIRALPHVHASEALDEADQEIEPT